MHLQVCFHILLRKKRGEGEKVGKRQNETIPYSRIKFSSSSKNNLNGHTIAFIYKMMYTYLLVEHQPDCVEKQSLEPLGLHAHE